MIRLILLTLLICAGFACGKKEKEPESPQTQAYRLIDQGQTEQAISLLTDEIKARDDRHQPDGDHSEETESLRMTLASAYLKMSGLVMKDILKSATEGSRVNQMQPVNLAILPGVDGEIGTKLAENSNLILEGYKRLQWASILPLVGAEQIEYLKYGLKIVESVRNKKPEDWLYSAIMKIVVLNSNFVPKVVSGAEARLIKIDSNCVVNIRDIKNNLIATSDQVIGILEDLLKALPARKDEYEALLNDVVSAKNTLLEIKEDSYSIASIQEALSLSLLFVSLGQALDTKACNLDSQLPPAQSK